MTSWTKDDIYSLIHSLKVVATIREHDKIRTKNGIHIDAYETKLSSIARWWNVECRAANIKVLTELFERDFQICEHLAVGTTPATYEQSQQLTRLLQYTSAALPGIQNLSVTYRDDTYTVASLNILLDQIRDKLAYLANIHGKQIPHSVTNVCTIVTSVSQNTATQEKICDTA